LFAARSALFGPILVGQAGPARALGCRVDHRPKVARRRAATARSGDLTKECSEYKGRAGDFCTITSSNLEEIEAGAKVIYAEAAGEGTLDTDVVLDAGSGNTAKGHVVLDLAANKGTATFSGGTGKFVGFEAQADVMADSGGSWHWRGTYSFD
jgi:hypothetical protein